MFEQMEAFLFPDFACVWFVLSDNKDPSVFHSWKRNAYLLYKQFQVVIAVKQALRPLIYSLLFFLFSTILWENIFLMWFYTISLQCVSDTGLVNLLRTFVSVFCFFSEQYSLQFPLLLKVRNIFLFINILFNHFCHVLFGRLLLFS